MCILIRRRITSLVLCKQIREVKLKKLLLIKQLTLVTS